MLFNVCLVLAPLAAFSAYLIAERNELYAYRLTEQNARQMRQRVERLSGELIMLDFDRRRQWDDLVALELIEGDIAAARGFLLSARAMLPARDADQINRAVRSNSGDAEIELAALALLTPGTRARYESTVPLLSRRSASGAANRPQDRFTVLGDARDFEEEAARVLRDPQASALSLTLIGLGLGLGGELTPQQALGASALEATVRRPDFSPAFTEEITILSDTAMPKEAFRADAFRRGDAAGANNPAAYAHSSAAFTAALQPERLTRFKGVLDEIGAIAEAAGIVSAGPMIEQARRLKDLERLRLLAQATGDRAVAVAKRAPRDGRLPRVAAGSLRLSPELNVALGAVAAALAGLLLALALMVRGAWAQTSAALRAKRGAPPPDEIEDDTLVRNFKTTSRVA